MTVKDKIDELFPKDMRKFNKPGWYPKRKSILKERITVPLTKNQKKAIVLLVNSGKFANQAEAVRYMIIKYLEELK